MEAEVVRETTEIKRLLIRLTRMRQSIHIGPLPPAADLRKYDQVIPGAADRIIQMAESEQAHGQAMDRDALSADKEIAGRGQHYALIVTLTLGVMGLVLGLTGHENVAIAFVVTGCVPIVSHFLGSLRGAAKAAPPSKSPRSPKGDSLPPPERRRDSPAEPGPRVS